jgi:SLT domain-containing protein
MDQRYRKHDSLGQERLIMSGIDQLRKAIFSPIGGLRRGGRIKQTGIYRLHAGERVVPAGRRRSVRS